MVLGESVQRSVAGAHTPGRALQYYVWVSTARWGWYQRALPDIVKHSFLIVPGRFKQESTLTSVGDPQLSNPIQKTGLN